MGLSQRQLRHVRVVVVDSPMLLAGALDHEYVGGVEVWGEAGLSRRRQVDIAAAPSNEMALYALGQFTELRVEFLGIPNAYRGAAPQVIRDDIEIGLPGLALLIDELSQVRPIEDVDMRRESTLAM